MSARARADGDALSRQRARDLNEEDAMLGISRDKRQRAARSSACAPAITRRGLLCATGATVLASLTGCASGDGAAGGDGEDDPAVAIVIDPPHPSSEALMVENACRLAEGEPTADDTLLRALEYSDPVFSVADRLPDGMTRADVYYFDLMETSVATVKNSQVPCEVAEDTSLPDGFAYLVVDVSIRNPLDEKAVFNVAGAMLGVYVADDDPVLMFEGIDASTYPRTEFDQLGYEGEGAYAIFNGADMPLWVSGYDGPGAMQPGDPTGDFWRDLWIIPQKRYQFYYVVSDEDLRRENLSWLISPRPDIDGAHTYAYRVEL